MPIPHICLVFRTLAYLMASGVFLYLLNNYLVFWQSLPGTFALLPHYGYFSLEQRILTDQQITQAWAQLGSYLVILLICAAYVFKTQNRSMVRESQRFAAMAAYIIRFSFWWVLCVGLADMILSFLRVENFLQFWVGEQLTQQLGRPVFRGTYLHYPLIILSLLIAARVKSVSFSWLALLVVLAEFLIVVTRFVFSYEQAYMGDLVRFWYAALFLFASAYTLAAGGHVRVDVLYAGFSRRTKAYFNSLGCALFGIPLCWVILMQGMSGRGSSINNPILSFEVSQSGYGMYVKYLMAAFLVVYAVSMLLQFISYLLFNLSLLTESDSIDDQPHYSQLVHAE